MNSSSNSISIGEWLTKRPYWEKLIWHKLQSENQSIEDADIEHAYQYLLDEHGLIPKIENKTQISFQDKPISHSLDESVKLDMILLKNINNVNALSNTLELNFSKNLTIIYGKNGSGKTGIIRLLSNACSSKGRRDILPNLKANEHNKERPNAEFHLKDENGNTKTIHYELGQNHEELKKFSVFDSKSVILHLDSANNVKFVPGQLTLFEKVIGALEQLEAKFEPERKSKQTSNIVLNYFIGHSSIVEFCKTISHSTDLKDLEELANFSANDEARIKVIIEDIAEKNRSDIGAKKKLLNTEIQELQWLKETLEKTLRVFSINIVNEINTLLTHIKDKKTLVKKLGVDTFQDGIFQTTGSDEWKALLEAAKVLYDIEMAQSPSKELNSCLLCHQPLDESAKSLFKNYWKFLESKAENELKALNQKYEKGIEWFKQSKQTFPMLLDTDTGVRILLKDNPEYLTILRNNFNSLHSTLSEWIDQYLSHQLSIKNIVIPEGVLVELETLAEVKSKQLNSLIDPAEEIKKLEVELTYLKHKKIITASKELVKEYISNQKWLKIAENVTFPKQAITRKRTQLFNSLISNEYKKILANEVQKLNCDFGLAIKTKGELGDTKKEIYLTFAEGYKSSNILSEGEQKVSSLADFLSESTLDKENCGLIFDDPVTSLDHERKELIAKRLVEESQNKQVIVFTHDIVLLYSLQKYAENQKVECSTQIIRKTGDITGVINPKLPWIAQNVSKREGYLKDKLVRIKKLEKENEEDQYIEEAKLWYQLLREAWERSVEERLFKGVLDRFRPDIKTLNLRYVSITQDMLNDINNGMTESSKWVHDSAAGLNPPTPTSEKLEKDLQTFSDFLKKCKAPN